MVLQSFKHGYRQIYALMEMSARVVSWLDRRFSRSIRSDDYRLSFGPRLSVGLAASSSTGGK